MVWNIFMDNNNNNNNKKKKKKKKKKNSQNCRLCCPGWLQNKSEEMWKEG